MSTKGYKGFNKGLNCRGFQYKEIETFTHEGYFAPCDSGFHFCENPLDILKYYPLIDENGDLSEFAEVEALGSVKSDEDKSVTNVIKIGAKLGLPGFVKASFDFLWQKCSEEHSEKDPGDSARLASSGDSARLASSGDSAQLASSGDSAQLASSGNGARLASSGYGARLASSGNGAQLASSGDSARLASSGYGAQLASSGYGARLASSGDSAQLASSGDSAQLASSGNGARLASSGYGARLASSGYGAQLASSGNGARLASSGYGARLASSGYGARLDLKGEYSVGASIGIGENRIRGVLGSWVTLAEWTYDRDIQKYKPVCVRSVLIDGDVMKADTWYTLRDGIFVEVE